MGGWIERCNDLGKFFWVRLLIHRLAKGNYGQPRAERASPVGSKHLQKGRLANGTLLQKITCRVVSTIEAWSWTLPYFHSRLNCSHFPRSRRCFVSWNRWCINMQSFKFVYQRLERSPRLDPSSWNSQLNNGLIIDKENAKIGTDLLRFLVLLVVDCDSPIRVSLSHWRMKISATHLPLGSVCFDQVGVQRITVSAQYGGKCSSNIIRYQ
jgi:hypothetical protein